MLQFWTYDAVLATAGTVSTAVKSETIFAAFLYSPLIVNYAWDKVSFPLLMSAFDIIYNNVVLKVSYEVLFEDNDASGYDDHVAKIAV